MFEQGSPVDLFAFDKVIESIDQRGGHARDRHGRRLQFEGQAERFSCSSLASSPFGQRISDRVSRMLEGLVSLVARSMGSEEH